MHRSLIACTAFLLVPFATPIAAAAPSILVLTAQTEHFRCYAARQSSGRVLRVDANANERAFVSLSRRLGVAFDDVIEYQRYEYPEEVAFHSGDPSLLTTGVAHPDLALIQSIRPSHPHEIVHILSARLGTPSPFFVEGLAVELGDEGRVGGKYAVDRFARPFASGSLPEKALASFRDVRDLDPWAAYAIAGSFTRYLVHSYGLATLVAFFKRSHPGVSGASAFEETFGVPVTAALGAWRAALR